MMKSGYLYPTYFLHPAKPSEPKGTGSKVASECSLRSVGCEGGGGVSHHTQRPHHHLIHGTAKVGDTIQVTLGSSGKAGPGQ